MTAVTDAGEGEGYMVKDHKCIVNKMYIVYSMVIIFQIVGLLYWMNVKTNYFIDELYSMGYASSYTGAGDTARYITTSDDWVLDEWKSNSEFKKYLLISEEERITNLSLPQAVMKIVTGSSGYFALLNLAESLYGYDVVSKYPGIILNIIFFVLAEIELITIASKIGMSQQSSALMLAMFGFSGYFVGFVEYIRFYMFVTLLVLTVILLHLIMWKTEKAWVTVLCELGSLVLLYLGISDSELMVIFGCALMLCYVIASLCTKQWKKLGIYFGMLLGVVVYLGVATPFIDVLFNVGNYAGYTGSDSALYGAASRVANYTITGIFYFAKWAFDIVAEYIFGHFLLFFLWCIVYTIFVAEYTKYSKAEGSFVHMGKIMAWGVWAVITAFTLMSHNYRGLILAWFLIMTLWVFLPPLIKMFRPNSEDIFMLVVCGVFLIYTVFVAMAGLNTSRYYCVGVTTFVILFWYLTDRALVLIGETRRKKCYCVLAILVIISSVAPYITRDIEYIYEEDQNLQNALHDYKGVDTVLAVEVDADGNVPRHEIYDCINLLTEDTQICPVNFEEYTYDANKCPDEFMLWTHAERNILSMLTELSTNGYSIEEIGSDHASKVYICRKE